MRLKNDVTGLDELFNCLSDFYQSRKRSFSCLDLGVKGNGDSEGDHYYVCFLLDKKTAIRYSIPIAFRTLPDLQLGIGPHYASLSELADLTNENFAYGFYLDSTTEAVEHNLKLLDQYLETQKCTCICPNCKK